MKLYLNNFSVSIDLSLDSVVGISIKGNKVYFIHSDSTITCFINGQIDCYRFGCSFNSSDSISLSDYFINFKKKSFIYGLQKKNEKKLESEKFPKRSRCKKS